MDKDDSCSGELSADINSYEDSISSKGKKTKFSYSIEWNPNTMENIKFLDFTVQHKTINFNSKYYLVRNSPITYTCMALTPTIIQKVIHFGHVCH